MLVHGFQWSIFWADLDPVKGSEQSGKRPVLIISNEQVNQSLPIVTIIPLTSYKPGRSIYPVEVLLPATDTGLSADSIAMAHQIRTIASDRLITRCGTIISNELRARVKQALRAHLDLL
jgi:mRNA interferase MazF